MPGLPPTTDHTFVVPAYGASPYLADCLRSLRAQTLTSRIVVASSTPYDGLRALAESFGAELALHSPNAGIGHDWNFAMAQAHTRWVTLAHQDDLYLPEFTRCSLDAGNARPGLGLVFTGYREHGDAGRRRLSAMLGVKRILLELGFLGRDAITARDAKLRALRLGCPIPCPAVTFNRNCLGEPVFRQDLRVNLDWDAWIRAARRGGGFAYVREPLMLHRIHAVSETSDAVRNGVRAAEDRMMFESLWPRPVARLLARAYTLSYEAGAG